MKNINYVINGILGAAVIVLFVLYFTGDSAEVPTQKKQVSDSARMAAGPSNIAYFKIDSVLTNWELYYDMQENLSTKQQQLESDFENKSQSFMKRVEDAQYKIQRGLVTRAEAEQLQQQLAQEEQNLMGLQNNYSAQIQEESVVKNRQMLDKIEQYLQEYNQTQGYDYIFSYTFGGNLFYADDAHDITMEVIEGINEAFPADAEK